MVSVCIAKSRPAGYTRRMRKTTLEFDEGLFEHTRQVLGTRGLKATVQRAFEEVLAVDARHRAIR